MPNDLFLHKADFLNTAKYVYRGILSQPFSIEKPGQGALYLLRNGEVFLGDKKEGPPQNEIVKILYRPQKGLAYFMIKVALVPLIVELYTQAFPESPSSKAFKTLSAEELATVQRMLLFHELKQGPLEYFKYCNNHELYASEESFYEDCLILAKMNNDFELNHIKKIFTEKGIAQPVNLSEAKLSLMYEAMHLAQFAVFINGNIDPLFKLAAAYPNSMRSLVAFLQTLSDMAKKLGLHQREFMETAHSLLQSISASDNLREKLIRDPGAVSGKIFDFCSKSDGLLDVDVLLAYQTLTQIELPDFEHLAKPYVHQEEEEIDDDPPEFASFNPAVEMNKTRKNKLR